MGALPANSKQKAVNRANIKVLTQFLKNQYETQLGIQFSDYPEIFPEVIRGDEKIQKVLQKLNPTLNNYFESQGY